MTIISWSIVLTSTTESSITSTIIFSEPHGTYRYSIANVSAYKLSAVMQTGFNDIILYLFSIIFGKNYIFNAFYFFSFSFFSAGCFHRSVTSSFVPLSVFLCLFLKYLPVPGFIVFFTCHINYIVYFYRIFCVYFLKTNPLNKMPISKF